MIQTRKVILLLIALIVLLATVSACRHTPDDEQVSQAIASVAKAAEAGSASGVIGPLGDDFDGNNGEMDRRSLGNMVRLIALRGEHVGVTTGPVTLEHRGTRIVASLTVALTSGSGGLLPAQLGVYQVGSAWRQEGDHWHCYSATWKQTGS